MAFVNFMRKERFDLLNCIHSSYNENKYFSKLKDDNLKKKEEERVVS